MEIVWDRKSDKAREILRLLEKDPLSLKNCVLALGGDGTMLKALHQYNFEPLFVGLNCGHRGALVNDIVENSLNRIQAGEFEIHEFPLLQVETDNGWQNLGLEVYFNRIGPKTCKTEVRVDGALITERLAGDGIDISTALASGGYFVPLGGSAVHPKLPVICFAPIARNTPFQIMPIVFPDTSVLEITLLSPPKEVRGWCDGQLQLPRFRKLTIRKAEKTLKLAFWKSEDFNKRLVNKIMKVQEEK